jgi:hypothetical protein
MFFPNGDWGAICPNTGKKFTFSDSYTVDSKEKNQYGHYASHSVYILSSMRFPKGNASEVEIVCPHCEDHQTHTFQNGQLFRPSSIVEKEEEREKNELKLAEIYDKDHEKIEKELRKEIETLKNKLEKERDSNQKILHEKDKLLDKQLANLTEAYMGIAKFVHEDLSKILQGQTPTKRVSYETTNP